jgi:hypothetical protein
MDASSFSVSAKNRPRPQIRLLETVARARCGCCDGCLALQLSFLKISESMGNHDSQFVDAGGID